MGAREEHPQSPGSSGHPLLPGRPPNPHCNTRERRARAPAPRRKNTEPRVPALCSAQRGRLPAEPVPGGGAGGERRSPPTAALQSHGGFPAPCHPPGTAPTASAWRSPVTQEAPASPSGANPPPGVPGCVPAKATGPPVPTAPSAHEHRGRGTHASGVHPPHPPESQPPRPTHPRGNSTRLGGISRGDVEAHVPGGCRVLSIPSLLPAGAALDHPALPRTGEMLSPQRANQPLVFCLFFFFPPSHMK